MKKVLIAVTTFIVVFSGLLVYWYDGGVKPEETLPMVNTVFYVNHNDSVVRGCAFDSCNILGYYHLNTDITLSSTSALTLDDLDKWVEIKPEGETQKAYIEKTALSDKPVK